MKTIKKYSFLLFLLLAGLSGNAQSVHSVSTAYQPGIPVTGASSDATVEDKLQVIFSIQGVEQLASVELLIGTTQGTGEVIKMIVPIEERSGKYVVVGPYGETLVENGKAHILLPWSKGAAGKGNFVSMAAISKAQVKSGYAYSEIQK